MYTVREPANWHSAFRPLVAAVLLLASTWGSIFLLKGWKSVWHKQQKPVAAKPYVPPVDPMLANDPDIKDAAKVKVIGPLANAVQDPAGSTEVGTAEVSEAAPVGLPSAARPADVDLVKGFRQLPPVRLFKGRLSVKGYRDLPFDIPPHASLPRISGTYRELGGGFARNAGLLVLSDQQFRDFVRGNRGDAVFSNDGFSGTIDVALRPTYAQGQTYHLLLRNSSRVGVLTEADFTVSFD
jgi:hypothetical protein